MALCLAWTACAHARLPAPDALRGYEVLIPGRDTLSRALADAFAATELRVRREVKGGGRPTVVLIHQVFAEPGPGGREWLTGRLADTRSSVILAAAHLPLDSAGTTGADRARALMRALLAVPPSAEP